MSFLAAARLAALGGLAACAPACVNVPEPPEARDLSALAARYDRPTGTIPESRIADFVARADEVLALGEFLKQLKFIKTLVSETSAGLDDNSASDEFDVQGVVDAAFPCPGDGPTATANGAINGLVRAKLGVLHSRLARGFTGALERCLVRVTPAAGESQSIALSGDLVADIGADLAIGDRLTTPMLVQVTNVVGSSMGQSSGSGFALDRADYDFRLTPDDAVEVLVDPSDFGLGSLGSVVVAFRDDGALSIRDSAHVYSCAGEKRTCAVLR